MMNANRICIGTIFVLLTIAFYVTGRDHATDAPHKQRQPSPEGITQGRAPVVEAGRATKMAAVSIRSASVDIEHLHADAGMVGDDAALWGRQADRWARLDPASSAAWVTGLPEGERKTAVLSAMTAAWADEDPEAAARLVAALNLPEGDARTQAMASVVSAWARSDPGAAAHWVETFPTVTREYAVGIVAFQWIESDPQAFITWAQQLTEPTDRDAAINAAVGSLVKSDPDLALRFSEGITNAGVRQRQTERAARRWLETDPIAARTWIRASQLGEETKQRLLTDSSPAPIVEGLGH